MPIGAWRERLRAWRARRAERRAADAAVDALFAGPAEVLGQGRLKRHHRGRIHILEIDADDEGIRRLLLGIVRHPKTHPMAPRGEEVLELLEYLPRAGTLQNVGGANLTRSSS